MRYAGAISAAITIGGGAILARHPVVGDSASLGVAFAACGPLIVIAGWLGRRVDGALLRLVEVFGIRVLTPAVIGFLAVVLYETDAAQTALSLLDVRPDRDSDQLTLEIFNATISTIYAIIVAFLVFKSMQDHDNINYVLRDEAMHLDSISQFLPWLSAVEDAKGRACVHAIQSKLLEYTRNVTSSEFKRRSQMAANQDIIDAVVVELSSLRLASSPRDALTLDHVMGRIDSLASVRARRIAYMLARPSPFMIIMMLVLSVFVVGPFFLTEGQMTADAAGSAALTPVILWFLTFSMTFLFLMMVDMASHFDGYWEVKRDAFADVGARIAARMRTDAAAEGA